MRADAYSSPTAFAGLAREWAALLTEATGYSIFATPEWAETWWRSFGGDSELHILAVRDDGDLLAIAPLFIEMVGGVPLVRLVGGIEVTDYTDIICAPGATAQVWKHVLAHLETEGHTNLDLHNVPGASATVDFFRHLADEGTYQVTIAVEDVCPVLAPLPPDWESYLNTLNRMHRHELRRKLRRLMDNVDLEAQVIWQHEDVAAAMDEFIALHRLSSPDKATFMDARMVGFFHAVAQMCQERGWLSLGFLTVQGKKVAATMSFTYGGSYRLYNSGFDPAYDALSVGYVLKALSVQRAIELGMERYDFLQGSERYKYELGGKDTQVYSIRCVRGRP